MNIYICHSTSHDFIDDLYEPIKKSNLINKHTIIFPHDIKNIEFNSLETIKLSDVIIAEVSYASTGMGIELGWANILNKQIIAIYLDHTQPSSALKFITENIASYNKENLEIIILEALRLCDSKKGNCV